MLAYGKFLWWVGVDLIGMYSVCEYQSQSEFVKKKKSRSAQISRGMGSPDPLEVELRSASSENPRSLGLELRSAPSEIPNKNWLYSRELAKHNKKEKDDNENAGKGRKKTGENTQTSGILPLPLTSAFSKVRDCWEQGTGSRSSLSPPSLPPPAITAISLDIFNVLYVFLSVLVLA